MQAFNAYNAFKQHYSLEALNKLGASEYFKPREVKLDANTLEATVEKIKERLEVRSPLQKVREKKIVLQNSQGKLVSTYSIYKRRSRS